MNKTRKSKKIMMLGAIILMVALVAAMGTMTYSRYVTTTDLDPQTATAAKWGFLVQANATNLFATDYTDPGTGLATKATTDGVAVNAENVVVAPGTTGYIDIKVSGKAEVLAKLTLALTLTEDIYATPTGGTKYNPIEWQIVVGTGAAVDANWETGADFVGTVEDTSAFIDAGTEVNTTYRIYWKWDLDNGNNAADTAIGIASHSGTTSVTVNEVDYTVNYELSFSLTATLTQEQTKP